MSKYRNTLQIVVEGDTKEELMGNLETILDAAEMVSVSQPTNTDSVIENPLDTIDDKQPVKPTIPKPVAYMKAGEATGKPGDTVVVELLGGCNVPVDGFAFALGMGSNLSVSKIEAGEFCKTYLSTRGGGAESWQQFPNGHPSPFFNYYCGFFSVTAKEVADPIVIPDNTVLAKIYYKIPVDHIAPYTEQLVIKQHFFKHTAEEPNALKFTNIYSTPKDSPYKYGVEPELMWGKITIVP